MTLARVCINTDKKRDNITTVSFTCQAAIQRKKVACRSSKIIVD